MNQEAIQNIIEIRLLNERINNHLNEKEIEDRTKELITEMAFFRDEFKNYLLNVTTTIISHFSLIVYAQLTNSHQDEINHWRGELKDRIVEFQDMDTKPKRNNRKMVKRVLEEAWVVKLELPNKPHLIYKKYKTKFEEEGIVTSASENEILTNTFISNIENIINEMAFGTEESALKFVNNIQIS